MPPIPTYSDYYIVVPVDPESLEVTEGTTSTPMGTPTVYVVGANDMDDAAQAVLDMGFPNVAVILATLYTQSAQPEGT
jgi:hypothetical protein